MADSMTMGDRGTSTSASFRLGANPATSLTFYMKIREGKNGMVMGLPDPRLAKKPVAGIAIL